MELLCGSEGLCPHCKSRDDCAFSTYRMNKEIQKEFGDGYGIGVSVLKCRDFVVNSKSMILSD